MEPSTEDLDWLVSNRSLNQNVCLKLYKIIKCHSETITQDKELWRAAGTLVSSIFSLWRAVFLADFKDFSKFQSDYEAFLQKLIQHNSVSYASDRESRHWSFVYYTENSRLRLKLLADSGQLLPKETDLSIIDTSSQAVWSKMHSLTETAVSNFGIILEGKTAKKDV